MSAIALPAVNFDVSRPKLVDSISVSRVGNRATSFVEYADPYWRVDMRTKPLVAADIALVEAFAAQARTGMKTVLFKPVDVCLPQAYWGDTGNAAVLDTGVVTAITNGFTVAFDGVTNGLTLQPGDRIGLEDGDYRALCRVVSGGVAADGALSVTVEPAVPGTIGVGATVRFLNPELNTRMLPGSFSIPDTALPVATFTLVEVPK